MSSVALQRVLVRMLYDPVFVGAVYADPQSALADCGLRSEERQWIVAADRRAFGVDPYRRSRSLHALLEEFPVSAAQALQGGTDLVSLHAFFSDAIFHEGMQRGDSLAALFAVYLLAQQPRLHSVVALEAAIARARRQRVQPNDRWQLADGIALLLEPAIAPTDYGALLAQRGEPARRIERLLSEQRPALAELPAPAQWQPLLIRAHQDVELEPLSEELAALLAVAQHGAKAEHWETLAQTLEVEAAELQESLGELVAEGILSAPRC